MRDREGLIARIRQMRRVPAAGDRPAGDRQDTRTGDPEVGPLPALEARVAHLERLLEVFRIPCTGNRSDTQS